MARLETIGARAELEFDPKLPCARVRVNEMVAYSRNCNWRPSESRVHVAQYATALISAMQLPEGLAVKRRGFMEAVGSKKHCVVFTLTDPEFPIIEGDPYENEFKNNNNRRSFVAKWKNMLEQAFVRAGDEVKETINEPPVHDRDGNEIGGSHAARARTSKPKGPREQGA